MPGVTRDRQYGHGRIGEKPFLIVDTGGIGYLEKDIDTPMAEQTKEAIGEADFVFFMLDAKAGVTPADRETAKIVRQSSKPVILVVNKSDGVNVTTDSAEFYQLGFDQPCFISAAHNRGIKELIVNALATLPESEDEVSKLNPKAIKVAVVGRPNVGKSTLINRLLGEELVVLFY